MRITTAGSPPLPAGGPGRHWVAALALASTPVLSACGAGFGAQTNQVYQAGEGSNSRSGDVYALNTVVVSDGEGNGTVVSALLNQQGTPDSLEDYSVTDTAGDAIDGPGLSQAIPLPAAGSAGQLVQVGTDGALRLDGQNLVLGSVVDVSFSFAEAAPVLLTVPVVEPGSVYADVPVGQLPKDVLT